MIVNAAGLPGHVLAEVTVLAALLDRNVRQKLREISLEIYLIFIFIWFLYFY